MLSVSSRALRGASKQRYRLAWITVLLLALALRLWGLDQHNIWWDEGLTAWAARLPVLQILDWTAHDVHPPLYFLLTRGWWLLIGDGAWGLRFLPALAGVLSVAVVAALGRALGGRRAGLLAALFLALSPFAVTWSQELRMYIWAALWAAVVLWAAVRIWRGGGIGAWAAYVLAAAAGLWTLYLSVATLAVTNLAFLWVWQRQGRPARTAAPKTSQHPERSSASVRAAESKDAALPGRLLRIGSFILYDGPKATKTPRGAVSNARDANRAFLARWVAAQVVAVALFLPWLVYALPRMMSWSSAEPYPAAFFVRLYATTLATGAAADLDPWLWPTVAVAAVLLIAMAALIVRIRRRDPATAGGLVMLILALALPPLAVYALTAWPGRVFYVPRLAPRYFLPLASAFYLLLGWGLAELSVWNRGFSRFGTQAEKPAKASIPGIPPAIIGTAIVAAVSVAGLAALLPGRVQTDQYTSLAATLDAHRRAGDVVFLYPDRDWPLFAGHYAGSWLKVPAGMAVTPEGVADLLAGPWAGAEGAWLVTTPVAQETDPAGLVRDWLATRAAGSATWIFGETSLTLYARTADRAAALWDLAPGTLPSEKPLAAFAGGELAAAAVPLRRYGAGDTVHLALTWRRPPDVAVTVTLAGPATRAVPLPPPPATQAGPARQIVSMPLLADLPAGRYRVLLTDVTGGTLEVGRFTLLARSAPAMAAADQITRPLSLRLGESIRLLGYDLPQTTFQPGEAVSLTLFWQADAALAVRYKVFTHLVGATWNAGSGNFLWGQQDNEPVADQLPTTRWTPGAVIADPYRIRLPADAPPGRYTVEVGMYGLLDGVRLPVFDAAGQAVGDAVVLGAITVR